MDRFDWQTEEEGLPAPVFDPKPRRRRRRWLAAVVVAAFLGLTAVVVWQLGRQVDVRQQRVNEDVVAAFGIWRQAVIRKDADLLGTLLLGSDAEWTATQRRLLSAGRFLERDALGLVLDQQDSAVTEMLPVVEVAGNWRSAEVTFPLTYHRSHTESAGSAVSLEHTLPLTREGSRWLLKRPDESFWGAWRSMADERAVLTYRARDASLAERILADLEKDLQQVCAAHKAVAACAAESPVMIRLESDPSVLFTLTNLERPAFLGRTFLLPSPTLVGKPQNELSYQALYDAYSTPILQTFAAMLAAPIQLPEQNVAMICFDRHGEGPRLYSYDPANDVWQRMQEGRAYRFLAAAEDDSSIALRESMPGEPNRLRIVQWSGAGTHMRHDATYDPLTDHQVGWVETAGAPTLLLGSYRGTMRQASYNMLDTQPDDVDDCLDSGCDAQPLDGFPAWSPGGDDSLVLIAGQVYRAGGNGRTIALLGEGHSPFWLDDQRYGFVRPAADGNGQQTEVVTGLTGQDELLSLWRTDALSETLAGIDNLHPVFVQHVEVVDGDPQRLLMYGRQYAGPDSQYLFFSLPILPGDGAGYGRPIAGPAQVELSLKSRPASLPSAGDPNGHVPFMISPDGQWLTVGALAEKASNRWTIHVKQIDGEGAFQFTTHYPGYSFSHPFFDWSADGRWLLIVDEAFLKLVAPALSFERVIAHEQRSCAYPAWVNR